MFLGLFSKVTDLRALPDIVTVFKKMSPFDGTSSAVQTPVTFHTKNSIFARGKLLYKNLNISLKSYSLYRKTLEENLSEKSNLERIPFEAVSKTAIINKKNRKFLFTFDSFYLLTFETFYLK